MKNGTARAPRLLAERAGSQLLCTVTREGAPAGFLAVDSTVAGRACGGLRLAPGVDEAEVRVLARSMTLKYGFLGLPQGGAKAGVRGDPEGPPEERRELLRAFGSALAPLLRARLYSPGPDMGTSNEDIRDLLEAAGVQPRRRELRGTSSGYYTALTVFESAKAACAQAGVALAGSEAAIEGFGKVGSALALLLAEAGARVVAVSTSRGALHEPAGLDVPRLARLAAAEGSRVAERGELGRRLPREGLLELPAALLFPCARHHSVHAQNAARVGARIVCPGANNPLTPEAEALLGARGVLCVPDFVANAGGVLGGTMEFASVPAPRIREFTGRHFRPRVARVLAEAAAQGVSPREVAEKEARRRFAEVVGRAARPSPLGRIFGLALEAYRRGWLPGPLVARLSLPYFERTVG
ncbi:MAG: Glu/Leu/Phe/Val dehydrogenase dimerization domain-containing protein [Thermodesulfobacteriota bacterium]